MHELPPSEDRELLYDEGQVRVYVEPYLDSVVWIVESPFEIERVYPDQETRSFVNRNNGDITTYFPGNRYTLEISGHQVIKGETLFDTTEFFRRGPNGKSIFG